MRLYQEIEQLFKYRINSNVEIPSFLSKMDRFGKMDSRKTLELVGILARRTAALEDRLELIEATMSEKPAPSVSMATVEPTIINFPPIESKQLS